MCFLAENQEGLYRVEVGALGSHANCILDKGLVSSHNRLCDIIDCKCKGKDNRFNSIIDGKARVL